MKSIIIQIRGEKNTMIDLISKYGFNCNSPLISAIYELYNQNTFLLNESVKTQLRAKIGGNCTENNLKVSVSRLIKKGVIIKNGKLLGLNPIFKEVEEKKQFVLQLV